MTDRSTNEKKDKACTIGPLPLTPVDPLTISTIADITHTDKEEFAIRNSNRNLVKDSGSHRKLCREKSRT